VRVYFSGLFVQGNIHNLVSGSFKLLVLLSGMMNNAYPLNMYTCYAI